MEVFINSLKMNLFSGFTWDVFCFKKKYLLYNLLTSNLKVRYRQSVLGLFWTLLKPLCMAGFYYFVFNKIMKVTLPNHLMFLLVGIFPWTFFSQTLMEGMESLTSHWGLLSKAPIPLQIFPLVSTLANMVTFFAALPILLGMSLVFTQPTFVLLLVFIYCFLLFLLCYGLALILSVLHVHFRDLKQMMALILQVWFFITPIMYEPSTMPKAYQWILYLNPIAFIFSGFQSVLVKGIPPQFLHFLIAVGWANGLLVLGILLHKYYTKNLVEKL